MVARNVSRAFVLLLTQAGLPPIRFHDLRHSVATLMLAQGVSPRVIMETLGHSQLGMTMNLYAHVMRRCSGRLRTSWTRCSAVRA